MPPLRAPMVDTHDDDDALHPPQLRASAPDADEDNVPRTPNVAESFHAHMKQLFNSPRPNQHTSTAGRKVYVNLQSLNCTL